uniref:Fibronectin type-III domain-containing protein n=1 Tax=Timema douglasi TaxID=61478 RepID=A0A7R8VVD5_TIMDO|nr:unnamed protein product [Timema douglasi]
MIPDVPTNLHVNYAEVDKVNLEWHAPVANPECVEWYEVCWKGGQIESCNNVTDIQDLITGLAPCGDYSANVAAVGAAGRSATSHLVVHTRNTAFNEIYILAVKSSNSTTLEVEWKAPFKNSECVQEYEVCWLGQETGGKGCMIQTTATTKATITGLISCVNYTVNVTAKGVMKNSTAVSMPYTQAQGNVMVISDKPAIQNVSLSRDSEGNITVTWHPLVEEMMCVRSYHVCWEQQSHPEDGQCLELPSSEDHLTISGLHSGTTYTVEVSAVLVTGETIRDNQRRYTNFRFVKYSDFTSSIHQLVICLSDTYKMKCLNVGEHIHVTAGNGPILEWSPNLPTEFKNDTTLVRGLKVVPTTCLPNFIFLGRVDVFEQFTWKYGSTTDRDSNLDLPVIGILIYCESSALYRAATKAAVESVSQLKVVSISGSTISIQWRAPSDTDCLEGYQVCWSLADGTQSNCTTQSRHEHATANITGLSPCTSYVINVTSVGTSGDSSQAVGTTATSGKRPNKSSKRFLRGDFSTSDDDGPNLALWADGFISRSPPTNLRPSNAPDKVSQLKVTSTSVSTISIEWRPPSNVDCLVAYQVCCSLANGNQSNCTTQTRHEHAATNITGLTPCTDFVVNVTTIGSSGNSSEAVDINVSSGIIVNATLVRLQQDSLSVLGHNEHQGLFLEASAVILRKKLPGFTDPLLWELKNSVIDPGVSCCSSPAPLILGIYRANVLPKVASTIPEQVTGLETTGTSISTITIQWRTPSNTECLQGYLVCWSLVDGDENGCVMQTRHEHATRNLTGLTQCGRYSISVTVVSSSDDYSEATNVTAFSSTVHFVAPLGVSVVDTSSSSSFNVHVGPPLRRVSNVRASETSSTSFLLEWDFLTEDTECLEDYAVCWEITGTFLNNCSSHPLDLAPEMNFTGLENCAPYTFTVTARDKSGESAANTIKATLRTETRVLPLTPGNVSSVETSSVGSSVITTWTPPSYRPQCVMQYEICWASSPGNQTCAVQENSVTTFEITELTPCSEYVVGVRALGQPDNSSRVNTTANTGEFDKPPVPDVPNHLHVNYAETDLLNVQWRVPTVNYECVQWYIVCWRSSEGRTEGCLNTTNLEQVITGLTPCANYSINITAVGAIGVSRASQMSAHTRSQALGELSYLVPIDGCMTQTRTTIPGLMSCGNYVVDVTTGDSLGDSRRVLSLHRVGAWVVTDYSLTQAVALTKPGVEGLKLAEAAQLSPRKVESLFLSCLRNSAQGNVTGISDKPAIQNVSLSRDSEGNITVTWHPLVEEMVCVRSYNVCWEQQSQPEDSQCLELPSSEDHLTISGLHSGTTYTVEVSAVLVTGETIRDNQRRYTNFRFLD